MSHNELCRRAFLWAAKYLQAVSVAQEPKGVSRRVWDVVAISRGDVHVIECKVSRDDLTHGISKQQLGFSLDPDVCPSDWLRHTSPGVTHVWLALADGVEWEDLAISGRLPSYVGILRPGVICSGLYHSKACGGKDGKVREECGNIHLPGLVVARKPRKVNTSVRHDRDVHLARWERVVARANTKRLVSNLETV